MASQRWDRSSLACAVSVTLVFWADTSLFHQSRTSGPPGAVLKCHPEPPTERCQPCVGLHHQILKHLSVILVSLPTVMPMGHSLVVPPCCFKKCYIMVKQVITIQSISSIFCFANKHRFLILEQSRGHFKSPTLSLLLCIIILIANYKAAHMSRDLIGFPVDLLKPSPPAEHTHASKYTVYNLCNHETAHSL